ncbi:hypothetical protein B0T17DRAFT_507409 [Bombardia bombarda]|uniref:Uncharacterized protein n=1 Tax=Bombardia bombarda TaxID=252184 RepID=A0AA40CB02_9PEZI|nr:hypothetical protein B0T17DRAFT_507409 [Bombardia bombarda]
MHEPQVAAATPRDEKLLLFDKQPNIVGREWNGTIGSHAPQISSGEASTETESIFSNTAAALDHFKPMIASYPVAFKASIQYNESPIEAVNQIRTLERVEPFFNDAVSAFAEDNLAVVSPDSEAKPPSWKIYRAAVYLSEVSGDIFWLTLLSNDSLKRETDRCQPFKESQHREKGPNRPKDLVASFQKQSSELDMHVDSQDLERHCRLAATLDTHLTYLQWSQGNWDEFLKYITGELSTINRSVIDIAPDIREPSSTTPVLSAAAENYRSLQDAVQRGVESLKLNTDALDQLCVWYSTRFKKYNSLDREIRYMNKFLGRAQSIRNCLFPAYCKLQEKQIEIEMMLLAYTTKHPIESSWEMVARWATSGLMLCPYDLKPSPSPSPSLLWRLPGCKHCKSSGQTQKVAKKVIKKASRVIVAKSGLQMKNSYSRTLPRFKTISNRLPQAQEFERYAVRILSKHSVPDNPFKAVEKEGIETSERQPSTEIHVYYCLMKSLKDVVEKGLLLLERDIQVVKELREWYLKWRTKRWDQGDGESLTIESLKQVGGMRDCLKEHFSSLKAYNSALGRTVARAKTLESKKIAV